MGSSSLWCDNFSFCAGKELPKGFVARVRTRKAGMSQVRGNARLLAWWRRNARAGLCVCLSCVQGSASAAG